MPKVHALLVGIDRYKLPELDLQGCVNDVDLAEALLRDRVAPGDLVVERLLDEQATRAGIIEAFRRHLGGLGPGDIALFWYSGHGSTAPLPEEIWYAESAGMCQTVVCHDSRADVADLYDKELGILAHEVVTTGAQLVTIMDSCHSRSGMRDVPVPGTKARLAPASTTAPALRDLLPELVAAAADPKRAAPGLQLPGHVALAACNEWERAREWPFADGWHGVFTEALGHALARLGPHATYRQVFSHARCRVEGWRSSQVPTLEALGDLADLEFLGGTLRPRASRISMRHLHGRWELDAGAMHGVVADARFGVHHAAPLQQVRVLSVHVRHSVVEPVGWAPDEEKHYEMVLTDVPLPPVAVSIEADPDVTARLTGTVQVSGPGGGPSPHVRLVRPADPFTSGLRLRVRQDHARGTVQIFGLDDRSLADPVGADDGGIEQTVRRLEHIARWLQIRNLPSASPALAEAIQIELVPAPADGSRPARGHEPPPVNDLVLDYTWNGTSWVPPTVFIRLRNTTDRRLFCVLLDLTDRYRMHANLFPGEYVEGGWTAEAGHGGAVAFRLPPDRPVEKGAFVTDWLVLLVAEEPFSSAPFSLPRLGERSRSVSRDTLPGINGVLDRLGMRAVQRDVELMPPPTALDWAVKVVEVTTRVP
ncbi:hypothetical protein CS0771_64900 [Catellatospora sp. IY07-71]|uniref:caspase family protein n=1 Tax=Catellatospora sp. IY07-71 TaxID=2728827 RepID=UPI001BB41ACD|nr:caspase family protein [Catellatospora sp. IY07-71]BCJ76946.1 hypothetical protein CS0771_64900 [Catellatospora sp. IY07-71]